MHEKQTLRVLSHACMQCLLRLYGVLVCFSPCTESVLTLTKTAGLRVSEQVWF